MKKVLFLTLISCAAIGQSSFSPGDISIRGQKNNNDFCATNTYIINFLTNVSSSTDGTSYATPAFTPSSNALLYANIWHDPGASGTTITVANTGSTNLTWWPVTKTNSGNTRMYLYVTQLPQGVSPSSMTVTLNASSTLTGCEIHIHEILGANQSALWGSNAIVQASSVLRATGGTPLDVQFTQSACGSNAIILNFGYIATSQATTTDSSWTQTLETGHTSPTIRLLSLYHIGVTTNFSSMSITNAANVVKMTTMMEVR